MPDREASAANTRGILCLVVAIACLTVSDALVGLAAARASLARATAALACCSPSCCRLCMRAMSPSMCGRWAELMASGKPAEKLAWASANNLPRVCVCVHSYARMYAHAQ